MVAEYSGMVALLGAIIFVVVLWVDTIKDAFKMSISAMIFVAIMPAMFELSFFTVIGYIITGVLAFYRGVVLKNPGFAFGYILTYVATSYLLPLVYKEVVQGTIVGALILLFVFLEIYQRGKQLQSH